MEFNEKLQELRKGRGLTQEELAESLFVSRAAVSKWESGRGYPSIDSLKDISVFFSVSIDDLLSGEKLISIAEKENKTAVRRLCELIFGISDVITLIFVALPLYPISVSEYIYSVNLFDYIKISIVNGIVYLSIYLLLGAAGIIKIILTEIEAEKLNKILTVISVCINILAVIFMGLSRQAYAVVLVFLILTVKGIILLKKAK